MGGWHERCAVMTLGGLLSSVMGNTEAGIRPDDPVTLQQSQSLADLIAISTDRPVHIVYVHGMRADGPGASDQFRKGLCKYLSGLCEQGPDPKQTKYFSLGPMPPATYLNQPIWRTANEWEASRPFVYRYIYRRGAAQPIIVDEVNWWPLLFPAKCRFIVHPEIDLSGIDKDHIRLCARSDAPYYPWLSEQERNDALHHDAISGGGAWINASLKQQIMNWGMSDAVIVLGPLRVFFRQAMNLAFDYASTFEGRGVDAQEFVVISESLGSFVVLDSFSDLLGSPAAASVGARTANLYFFANQFSLLQLGRIDGLGGPGKLGGPVPSVSPVDLLKLWAQSGAGLGKLGVRVRPKQVIAFSDPSDFLTFPVPKLKDTAGQDIAWVVNCYDRNEWSFFRLFANPLKAHTGHAGNDSVLEVIFRPPMSR